MAIPQTNPIAEHAKKLCVIAKTFLYLKNFHSSTLPHPNCDSPSLPEHHFPQGIPSQPWTTQNCTSCTSTVLYCGCNRIHCRWLLQVRERQRARLSGLGFRFSIVRAFYEREIQRKEIEWRFYKNARVITEGY